jgi:hypothetical protein
MRLISLIGLVLVTVPRAQAQSSRRTYAPESGERNARRVPAIFDMTGSILAHWSCQALIGVEHNNADGPLIYVIDKEGLRDHFTFTFDDVGLINVHGLANSPDGTVAVTGGFSGNSGPETFLALVSADRKHQTVTRIWPYVPWEVTFAPDGTLWTVGYTFREKENVIVTPNVLSHFDRAGKLLANFAVTARARLGSGQSAALQHSFLRVSRDRIGWFTNGMEYIEFSLEGREVGRYDGPEVADRSKAAMWGSFGLSEGNEVLFSTILNASIPAHGVAKPSKRATWSLDRESRQWIPVEIQDSDLPGWSQVLGFDGSILVTTGHFHEMLRYKQLNRILAR